MTIAEARLQLIKRSPVYFLQEIVPLQIHHGYDDEIVPVTQAEELIEIAEKLNLNETQFQAYLHEYSGHDENTFLKGIDEMKDFINF
jgi:predicted esterase